MGSNTYAALDLGSNSFHLVVAQANEDSLLTFVDRRKEYVRLAGGLGEDGMLSELAMQRAIECLRRYGERLSELPSARVRAVGTNTFRKARNGKELLERLEEVLGHRIDVISGREEARLVYRGVCVEVNEPGPKVVIDIGGGSTEVILGDGDQVMSLDSHYLGCVSWTRRFFGDGELSPAAFKAATTAARRELGSDYRKYRGKFDFALGSSGTNMAIERTVLQLGMSTDGITPDSLDALQERLCRFQHVDDISLPEVSSERARVLPGGLAVLRGVMKALKIKKLNAVGSALREGLLLEMLGRAQNEDIRVRTIERMASGFNVDVEHASRVAELSLSLFDQVGSDWGLKKEPHRRLLEWAVMLHEVGLFMGFSGYHKHGAYLLANSDMPGFSWQEQRTLASMVLGHRGRFDRRRIKALHPGRGMSLKCILLMRVAKRLHRSRSTTPLPRIDATAEGKGLWLSFPDGWLREHPLTEADLYEEKRQCANAGFNLEFE